MYHKFLIVIAFCFFSTLHAMGQDKLTLQDFNVQEVPMEDRNAIFYDLSLSKDGKDISVRLYAKPEKIVTSFLDDQYLVLLYRKGNTHYLTGAYHDGTQWKQDYFHKQLGFGTGLSVENVKSAEFLDGATLKVSFEKHSAGKKEPEIRQALFRICADDIYEYQQTDSFLQYQGKGNNPIRPSK